MRKIYLFVLSAVLATLSAFAQFSSTPEFASSFDANSKIWYKVGFVDENSTIKYMTTKAPTYWFELEDANNQDSQLWQLVGNNTDGFELISKTGLYAYIDNYKFAGFTSSKKGEWGQHNLFKLVDSNKPAYNGTATKQISFEGQWGTEYLQASGPYVGSEDPNAYAGASIKSSIVFFKVNLDEGGGTTEEPKEKTFSIQTVVNGDGSIRILNKATGEDITNLTAVPEGTEIEIIANPRSGSILKQINGGTLFADVWDYNGGATFDPINGQTNRTYTTTLTASTTITATFVEKPQEVMLLRQVNPNDAAGTFKVFYASNNEEVLANNIYTGTELYIVAEPAEGYVLKQVNIFAQDKSGQGDLLNEADFNPETGFDTTVRGINPLRAATRITVTFAEKQVPEAPEEVVVTEEGFTNAPTIVPTFDSNATKWYKIGFVTDGSDDVKYLTDNGADKQFTLDAEVENADNQLWQLVGDEKNGFEIMSKAGLFAYLNDYYFTGFTTSQKGQWQQFLVKVKKSKNPDFKTVPTKQLELINANQVIVPDGNKVSTGSEEFYGTPIKTSVIFKQVVEEVVKQVGVTVVQPQGLGATITVEGVTGDPTQTYEGQLWQLNEGQEYTLKIVAPKGYELAYIMDNYTYVQSTEAKFTPNENITRLEVHFKQKKYIVPLEQKFDGGIIKLKDMYREDFPLGQELTLEAIPNPGYKLEYIKVRDENITDSKKFLVDEDNTLDVSFIKKTTGTIYTLTQEGGSVTIEGHQDKEEVKLGTELSLTVNVTEGYELISLKVGGTDVKDSKKFTVAVDNTIEAVFQKKTYSLTAPTTEGGKLSFTNVEAGQKVEYGTEVAVSVVPEEGYELVSLTAGGKDIKEAKSFVVGDNNEILAVFKKKTYKLSLPEATEEGSVEFEGNITAEKEVEYGTEVSLKILPKKGYELKTLTVGGKDISQDKKFTVGDDNTILVSFAEKFYTLVAPKVDGGKIEFLGIEEGAKLKMGQKVRIKVTPNKGYTLDKLTAGGKDISSDYILTVDEDNTIELAFRKVTAIESLDGISFAVYPNPATELIKLEGLNANAQVQIISISGKLMLSAKADFVGSLQINVSHLPKGLYLVRSGKAVVKLQLR